MPTTSRRPARCYFSLRSPYSWLALHDLLRDRPDVADRLEWRPFWEPDALSEKLLAEAGGAFPYTPMSRAKQFYILRDVRRLTAERGLAVTWPVDDSPWWEVPHLAWFVAERHGLGRAWIERLSRARWQEGRDICDPATVGELAEELGIDAEAARGAVDDPDVRERGVRALLDIEDDGVFGVPFFTRGRDAYWGLDRLPAFLAALPVPAPDGAAELVAAGLGAVDAGHAGGCG